MQFMLSQMNAVLRKVLAFGNLLLFFAVPSNAQQPMSLSEAIQTAVQNNEGVKAAELDIAYYREQKKASSDIGKFSATWMHGQYNSSYQDNNFSLTQTLPFPTAMTSMLRLGREQIVGAEKNLLVAKGDLVHEVKTTYLQLLYLLSYRELLQSQDSLYRNVARASALRLKAGESNLLEKTTADAQAMEAKNLLLQVASDIRIQQTKLQALLRTDKLITASDVFKTWATDDDTTGLGNNSRLILLRQQVIIGAQAERVERSKLFPDISIGYFNQSLRGVQNISGQDVYYGSGSRFQGFQLGLAFPLWVAPHIARVKAAAVREKQLQKSADYYHTILQSQLTQVIQEISKHRVNLQYYEGTALANANLILSQSQKSFSAGEIGYLEYWQALKTGVSIKTNYLQAVNLYNLSIINLDFLLGNF